MQEHLEGQKAAQECAGVSFEEQEVTKEYVPYERTQMEKETILQKMREQGCRITRQRRILLDVILEGDCSCCKEIYYKAAERDSSIGMATVYRMMNVLEGVGAVRRGNFYHIACGDAERGYRIELSDDTTCRLSAEVWRTVIRAGLRACGYIQEQDIRRIVGADV